MLIEIGSTFTDKRDPVLRSGPPRRLVVKSGDFIRHVRFDNEREAQKARERMILDLVAAGHTVKEI
jgi:hypothetical protein